MIKKLMVSLYLIISIVFLPIFLIIIMVGSKLEDLGDDIYE